MSGPAAGNVVVSGGRHRRAEPAPRRPATLADLTGPDAYAFPPRPAHRRHRSTRPARRPATGSHRAPGTLPIESWLLMGKGRQQLLLASLVAAGLLLVALPTAQRAQNDADPVNASAAERAVAAAPAATHRTSTPTRPAAAGAGTEEKPQAPAAPPTATAITPPVAAPTAPAPTAPASAAASTPPATDLGPGLSLRTTGTAAVALTFDDGPDPVQTPKILQLLDRYQLKATFCLVGTQVERHPDVVRSIAAAGHTLCNHTWNHSLTIGKADPAAIRTDLARTNAAIEKAVPGAPIPFFRAPGGNFTDRLVGVAAESAMTSLYWEVDPRDWEHPEGETAEQHVQRVIDQVRGSVKPGAIVLSHDFNQPGTVLAYEELLPWLKENFTVGMPEQNAAPASTPAAAAPTTPPTDS